MHHSSKENITSVLVRIQTLVNGTSWGSIEKDLMLQYTRSLYETILETDIDRETLPTNQTIEDKEISNEDIAPETDAPLLTTAQIQAENLTERNELEKNKAGNETTIREDHPEEESLNTKEEQAAVHEQLYMHIPSGNGDKTFKVWEKDIRSYIGINDKYNFISELFDDNAEAYEEILTEVNSCESKEESLLFLENAGITTLYKWQMDSHSVRIFHNILSQFFSAR